VGYYIIRVVIHPPPRNRHRVVHERRGE
jgi:hypothetical protein